MIKIRNTVFILILLVLTYGTGYNFGRNSIPPFKRNTVESRTPDLRGYDFSLFWDVWDRLKYYYIDKEKLDPAKLIYGAISGMVASLDDPYTVFLSPEQNQEAKDDLGGKFEGIGAQLGVKDKKIVIVAPLKKSPAETAGLKAGDWIIKVDGEDTVNWTLPEAVSKIRGPKGSQVMLNILHAEADKSEDVSVFRDEIKVASVELDVIYLDCTSDPGAGCQKADANAASGLKFYHLKLGRFGDNTNSEWNKIVSQIKAQYNPGTDAGIIFDLRNNPGGYLSSSVFIASEFIDQGAVVIQENADGSKKTYNVERPGKLLEIPLIVLINKGSASASEIVAGSLRVRNKTKLAGETSFGKGTIQEAQELSKGAGIHITTAKWLLPDGTWINGEGLKPDVEVESDLESEDDNQLLQAAKILSK
ncbi:MAG: carboxy-terminal-processing protease, carboxyl-terminal processing protease [Candidatus Gottesmanbacteria bacterium GW2011_GWA2_43_14]|uniref:Carboxy-terminal-processing protease, carboxyl-terminal processing protease n=1 Tax=Candidatus Gottesmanbacteria bacterium GW2011_GWA2_43_14 TaxID=1618443 RepID=A0A0G1DIH7_9BACT|nr:MAG: carboxy-terminal-processing protease, carboxyl-terminal processing protease [Candidatus Gottesmanbacteria bacterium GW2011_GWA2_43_14]